jgi:hypothetical protein
MCWSLALSFTMARLVSGPASDTAVAEAEQPIMPGECIDGCRRDSRTERRIRCGPTIR